MSKKIKFLSILPFLINPIHSVNAQTIPTQYTELLEYIVPSPYQGKTDNCLYMATTGAVEILANRYHNITHPKSNSEFDFNEKTALRGQLDESLSWFENPVLRFNSGAVTNRNLSYDGKTFWGSSFTKKDKINLPPIKTNWFLKTDNGSTKGRFSYDEFKNRDIEKIKQMLVKYRSPIVIIYRTAGKDGGYGYWNTWHTATIVGYDDQIKRKEKCPIVEETVKSISPIAKKALKAALIRDKGCGTHGVFYIRDSEDPIRGQSRVAPYVLRSYDDIKYLGTNAMVVYMSELLNQ